MKIIKTSQLTGAALDWAVCASMPAATGMQREILSRPITYRWKFSTDPAQGHPIIEREGISWHCGNKTSWHAYAYGSATNYNGPTPLVAAMRCYVASKLGDTVEVPEELL